MLELEVQQQQQQPFKIVVQTILFEFYFVHLLSFEMHSKTYTARIQKEADFLFVMRMEMKSCAHWIYE